MNVNKVNQAKQSFLKTVVIVLMIMFFGVSLNNVFALNEDLLCAIEAGDINKVRELAQIQVNLTPDEMGRTALMYASVNLNSNSEKIIKILNEFGWYDSAKTDKYGRNAYAYAKTWYNDFKNHADKSDKLLARIRDISGERESYQMMNGDTLFDEILDWKRKISNKNSSKMFGMNELIQRGSKNKSSGAKNEWFTQEPSIDTVIVPAHRTNSGIIDSDNLSAIMKLFCSGTEDLGNEFSSKEKEIYKNAKEIEKNSIENTNERGCLYIFFRFLDGKGEINHVEAESLLNCFYEQIKILNDKKGIVVQYKLDKSQYKAYAFFYILMTIYLTGKEGNISKVIINRISRDFALKVVVDGMREKEAADDSINKYYNTSICCGSTRSEINNLVSFLYETIAEYKNLPSEIVDQLKEFNTNFNVHLTEICEDIKYKIFDPTSKLIYDADHDINYVSKQVDSRILKPGNEVINTVKCRLTPQSFIERALFTIGKGIVGQFIGWN